MIFYDDTHVASPEIEVIHPVGKRPITHVIHDIDGTHSLIRDWPPVMSLSIHWAMTCGLRDDFDSDENLKKLIDRVGAEPLPETDRFCVESAGLSALTQMEYGIRRAIELGNVPDDAGFALTEEQARHNSVIIKRIWNGEERFADVVEPPALLDFINERTPRLFVLYEKILNGACRDRNTRDAWQNPAKWRVPGSMEFIGRLHELGCVNYFVTGAVIYEDGGMYEEVRAIGFEVGPGKMFEGLRGSSWDRKLPKHEVIESLLAELSIDPAEVLIIGDGRSEIKAGVDLGCVTMSRLPVEAKRQRELHVDLGANVIVKDFASPALGGMIYKETAD
ncbi:MAG: HAD family hydrolase [Phycisphaerae bacterium]|nr:HAD family hydrolase [Phycisphaerae bacterium]